MVSSLSTEVFLAALSRFSNRRGSPSHIFSDCGTNFVGADRKLKQLVNSPQERDRLLKSTSAEWSFSPPSAPHFGGLFEAAVKSTKSLLMKVMGNHVFTMEEFITVLTRIEAVLNSRPLTPMSDDPNDFTCLTPGHFIVGHPLLALPEEDVSESKLPNSQRWKLMQQCHQAFWKRWSKEYLQTLQLRNKWTKQQPNVQTGNMVVIKEDNTSPLAWRLGRIVETFPGQDGVVQVAKVKTMHGEIIRPVVKLVLLLN